MLQIYSYPGRPAPHIGCGFFPRGPQAACIDLGRSRRRGWSRGPASAEGLKRGRIARATGVRSPARSATAMPRTRVCASDLHSPPSLASRGPTPSSRAPSTSKNWSGIPAASALCRCSVQKLNDHLEHQLFCFFKETTFYSKKK